MAIKMTGKQYKDFSSNDNWGEKEWVENEFIEIDGVAYSDEDSDYPDMPEPSTIPDTTIVKILSGVVNRSAGLDSVEYTTYARRWLNKHKSSDNHRLLIEVLPAHYVAFKKYLASSEGKKLKLKILVDD